MKHMKLSQTFMFEEMKKRKSELELLIKEKELSLINVPEGEIRIVDNKNTSQYFLRRNASEINGQYLNYKKNKQLINQLAQKKYDMKILKEARGELQQIDKFLKKYDSQNHIRDVYSNSCQGFKKIVVANDLSDEDLINAWMSQTVSSKDTSNLKTEFYSEKGEHVRSKSEILIANSLLRAGIPYKYEYPLDLGDGIERHPDFTILDIKRRRILYWEHLGMIDNRGYLDDAIDRIEKYKRNGIYPGVELVISYETYDKPLSTIDINEIIKRYFL